MITPLWFHPLEMRQLLSYHAIIGNSNNIQFPPIKYAFVDNNANDKCAWEKHMRVGVIYADKHIISCKKVTLTDHVIPAYVLIPRYKKTIGSQTPLSYILSKRVSMYIVGF